MLILYDARAHTRGHSRALYGLLGAGKALGATHSRANLVTLTVQHGSKPASPTLAQSISSGAQISTLSRIHRSGQAHRRTAHDLHRLENAVEPPFTASVRGIGLSSKQEVQLTSPGNTLNRSGFIGRVISLR